MKLRATQEEEDAEVQMAPLIDCVFILLIFFLVTSMLQKPHNELLFDVPNSGAGTVDSKEKEPVVIVLQSSHPDPDIAKEKQSEGPSREPFIVIGGELLTKQLLERRLREIAHQDPNRRIRIDTVPGLVWRHVILILNLCRFHGLVRVDIRRI